MTPNFKKELDNAQNLQQVFNLVNQHFDTGEKFGIFSGSVVKNKIPDIIKLLNLKPKK